MSVKIREVLATIHYAESGRKEQELVHFFLLKTMKSISFTSILCRVRLCIFL